MKRSILALASALFFLTAATATAAPAVAVYDDGEKLRGERERALPPSVFGNGPIELFAIPGETLALQLVVDADEKLEGVHAEMAPIPHAGGSAPLALSLTSYAVRFVRVERPSGNDREPGSLAFLPGAAPAPEPFVGLLADALVPKPLDLDPGTRGALWIDLAVPADARSGLYEGPLVVSAQSGGVGRAIAMPALRIEIGAGKLPFAAAKVAVFYDPVTLDKRMGGRAAEISLRHLLHAHHLSALPERKAPTELDIDLPALTGELFTPARDYGGPGQGIGEGVFAIGAYGSLGEPSPDKVPLVEAFVERLRGAGALEKTEVFLYAVDEDCKSPRAARWLELLAKANVGPLRIGVTCSDPPKKQAATLVMNPASTYDPEAAEEGKRRGKSVWAYNGIRPHAGPLMLDVPAVDLRANAWIAMRYGVDRWFYWESSYWLDNNRGGRGGAAGFDPYVVAETFHNADGDYAMGDGILVYPGTQTPPGMTNYGEAAFYPSVRLKNLRRGVLDAGYIALAREKDRARADAVVAQIVPRALSEAKDRAAWPDDAKAFLAARRALFAIAQGPVVPQVAAPQISLWSRVRPYASFVLAAFCVAAVFGWLRRSLAR